MTLSRLATKLSSRLFSKPVDNTPIYSQDWFSNNEKPWSQWLKHLKGMPNIECLEIGSYEGRSTRWLLDNILTHPSAKIFCIDTLEGGREHKEDLVDMNPVRRNFFHNIRPHRKKVQVFISYSQEIIRLKPHIFCPNRFDLIYLDGSHIASDVLEDAVLTFRLLKRNGILIFDDYEWDRYPTNPALNPRIAIDSWLACYAGQYELIAKGYQVCVKKTV